MEEWGWLVEFMVLFPVPFILPRWPLFTTDVLAMVNFCIAVIFFLTILLVGSVGYMFFEQSGFREGFYLTAMTISTVGYGDIVPVTDVGRVIAIFYMFFGVTVLGIALSVLATNYYKKRFEVLKKKKKINFQKQYFHLGYVGKLNTGRNPRKILNLLSIPINKKQTILHFIGLNSSEQKNIIDEARSLELEVGRIKFISRVNRSDSLGYMKSFNGLILLVNNVARIKNGYGIPGKLYDYVFASNNIFSDRNTFENINEEIDCEIKNEYEDFINYRINITETLDDKFKTIINEIISV